MAEKLCKIDYDLLKHIEQGHNVVHLAYSPANAIAKAWMFEHDKLIETTEYFEHAWRVKLTDKAKSLMKDYEKEEQIDVTI